MCVSLLFVHHRVCVCVSIFDVCISVSQSLYLSLLCECVCWWVNSLIGIISLSTWEFFGFEHTTLKTQRRERAQWVRQRGDWGQAEMEGWSDEGSAEQHGATQSGSLPADQSSESILSTSADFPKSNECVYMHTALQPAVLILIKFLFWINSFKSQYKTSNPSINMNKYLLQVIYSHLTFIHCWGCNNPILWWDISPELIIGLIHDTHLFYSHQFYVCERCYIRCQQHSQYAGRQQTQPFTKLGK